MKDIEERRRLVATALTGKLRWLLESFAVKHGFEDVNAALPAFVDEIIEIQDKERETELVEFNDVQFEHLNRVLEGYDFKLKRSKDNHHAFVYVHNRKRVIVVAPFHILLQEGYVQQAREILNDITLTEDDWRIFTKKRRTKIKAKPLEYYLSLPYSIELIPDKDGVWFASIPLLKGCMTQGDSREDALVMLDEAKSLWLETALAERINIPEPVGIAS